MIQISEGFPTSEYQETKTGKYESTSKPRKGTRHFHITKVG